MATLSSDDFKYWLIDRVNRQTRIVMQDGQKLTTPIPADDPILDSELATTGFDWEKWWVINTTKRGHIIFAEAYSPTTTDPLGGRPSVYLDQNYWSMVAQAVSDPSRIRSTTERDAAVRFVELAGDAGIVVPMSSSTLLETARLTGDRRYEVGVAIATFANGWQMRHVLEIQAAEMLTAFGALLDVEPPEPAGRPAITLEPNAWYQRNPRAWEVDVDSLELFQMAIMSPAVVVDVLLDPEEIESTPVDWASKNQEINQIIAAQPKNRRREAALAFAWIDYQAAIDSALTALGHDRKSLTSLDNRRLRRLLRSMPMTGLFTELMIQRHLDAGRRWRDNDLVDMFQLAAGAAYADYTVGERGTGSQLQQIQRARGDRPTVFVTLADAVAQMAADGVLTDTERKAL